MLLALSAAYAAEPLTAPAPPPVAAVVGAPAPPESDVVRLRVSVLPGLGLGAAPDAAVDGVAVGLVSRAASLRGVDGELFVSWVDGPVRGAQGSPFLNVAGADVRGVQASGVANVAAGAVDGVQGAAFANVAVGGGRGVQGSGGLNVAGDYEGVQAAPLNVARSIDGLQLGLVNVGGDVKGVQLGLVNIARTSQVSIAPINLVGDGLHEVVVWTSESAVANAGLKFGSKHVYTLLAVGYVSPSTPWWTWGGGFGVHLVRDPLWVEVDATAWGISRGQVVAPGVHSKLRAQVGIDLARHFSPFAGVSMNTWVGDGSVWPRAIGIPSEREAGRQVVTWPGFHVGVSL